MYTWKRKEQKKKRKEKKRKRREELKEQELHYFIEGIDYFIDHKSVKIFVASQRYFLGITGPSHARSLKSTNLPCPPNLGRTLCH